MLRARFTFFFLRSANYSIFHCGGRAKHRKTHRHNRTILPSIQTDIITATIVSVRSATSPPHSGQTQIYPLLSLVQQHIHETFDSTQLDHCIHPHPHSFHVVKHHGKKNHKTCTRESLPLGLRRQRPFTSSPSHPFPNPCKTGGILLPGRKKYGPKPCRRPPGVRKLSLVLPSRERRASNRRRRLLLGGRGLGWYDSGFSGAFF